MADEIEIPEGWARHDGGECPVEPSTLVDVIFRDGFEAQGCSAHCWDWDWDEFTGPSDLIAYRILVRRV